MLSEETKQQIKQRAKDYARTTLANAPIGVPNSFVQEDKFNGYIAGATAEAERANALIECLNSVKAIGHPDRRVINLINEALAAYNANHTVK